jgi:hypothetical protein
MAIIWENSVSGAKNVDSNVSVKYAVTCKRAGKGFIVAVVS